MTFSQSIIEMHLRAPWQEYLDEHSRVLVDQSYGVYRLRPKKGPIKAKVVIKEGWGEAHWDGFPQFFIELIATSPHIPNPVPITIELGRIHPVPSCCGAALISDCNFGAVPTSYLDLFLKYATEVYAIKNNKGVLEYWLSHRQIPEGEPLLKANGFKQRTEYIYNPNSGNGIALWMKPGRLFEFPKK